MEYIYEKELKIAAKKLDSKMGCLKIFTQDLREIFKQDINDMINYRNELYRNPKGKILLDIYFKPYLLYYSRYLKDDLLDEFNSFLQNRYIQEKNDLDQNLYDYTISKNDYDKELEKMNNYYFYSSSYYGTYNLRIIEKDKKVKTI